MPGFTPTYDANGNVLTDGSHTYAWDVNGNSVSLDGVSLTFDALDRMVEQNRSGTYTEIVYSPGSAKLALMSGQTLLKAFVPLPGQATAVYTSSGLDHYRHSDWLGSARLTSSPTRAVLSTTAYAPFGETYVQSGTADVSFTGQNSDTVPGDYDFLYREYSIQGRWASPDPAGLAAVDPTNPQSWNRYSYVANVPLDFVDPKGLEIMALGGCYWDHVIGYVDGQYAGEDFVFLGCIDAFGSRGGLVSGGGGGGGGGSSGNSSGYHFQLFPGSLRLPGESFGACVDRTQTALLGDTGKGLLGGITGASLVTSIFTSSPGTTLAAAGKIQGEVVNNLGAQISGDVIQTQLVPKPSIAANAINEGIAAGSVPADVGAAAVKGANFLGKFASVLTAIGVGIEGGFLVSCR